MVAPITASKKVALIKDTWWIIPALAAPSAPAITDINAAGGLNITGFMLGDQEGFTSDVGKVELPRLLLEAGTTETLDQQKWSLPDFRLLFDPQAAAAANDKKAWALLKSGFTGFIVRRQNIVSNVSDAAVAGQFVDNAPITASLGTPTKTDTGPAGVYAFDITIGLTGNPVWNVAVV